MRKGISCDDFFKMGLIFMLSLPKSITMRQTLSAFLLIGSLPVFSQTHILQLQNKNTGKTTLINTGDKVLMAVRLARHDVKRKPLSVYKLSKNELSDSAFVFTKGKIKTITDSSIFIKERNSFFSSTLREVKLEKINTLKKLSLGKQVFRTTATIAGSLAAGVALFYSYVATGGGDGFVEGMFVAAGGAAVLTPFGRTRIPKKQLNKQEIKLAGSTP